MPRDLLPPSSPPPLMVASPESQTFGQEGAEDIPSQEQEYKEFTIHRDETSSVQQLRNQRAKADERNDLHPYVQTLSISNLESCLALENAIFPPQERCSREKVRYPSQFCTANWPRNAFYYYRLDYDCVRRSGGKDWICLWNLTEV